MRVVLAYDGVLFRTGLARCAPRPGSGWSLTEAGVEVVGEADHPDDSPGVVDATAPDVTVLDVRMPPAYPLEGPDAARDLRRQDRRERVRSPGGRCAKAARGRPP